MNLDSVNAAVESPTSTAALFEEIPLYAEGFLKTLKNFSCYLRF